MWKKCYLHQQCEAELVHPLHTFSLAAQVTKWRTFPLKFQRRNKKKLSVRQSDLLENERLVSESSDCICVSEDRLGLFQGLSRVFHFFFFITAVHFRCPGALFYHDKDNPNCTRCCSVHTASSAQMFSSVLSDCSYVQP